jgi:cation transporter protein
MGSSIGRTIISTLNDTFFTFTTVKVVKVPNTFIALINRILQLLIFAYIALYIVWWKKGYQEFQEPRGTSVIKVKGVAKVIGNSTVPYIQANTEHLWDNTEYQLPPLENNAFFIATRQIVTYNQKEDKCASALDEKLFCNRSIPDTCQVNKITDNAFGFTTGNCVQSVQNASVNVCEISAWCPEELTDSVEYVVDKDEVRNFTVYLKTMVKFEFLDKPLRNVRDKTNFTCRYDKVSDPYCPIFRIGYVIDGLNTNISALLHEGGLIEIRQDWTCDFDYSTNRCYPELTFNILQSGDDQDSPGINYRYATKYRVNDTDYRILSKVYGLRFVVAISGRGGRFNIVNLFVAIGSGIGFMVIAGIVCDAIFMYIHKSREQYRQRKFSVCEVTVKRASSNED